MTTQFLIWSYYSHGIYSLLFQDLSAQCQTTFNSMQHYVTHGKHCTFYVFIVRPLHSQIQHQFYYKVFVDICDNHKTNKIFSQCLTLQVDQLSTQVTKFVQYLMCCTNPMTCIIHGEVILKRRVLALSWFSQLLFGHPYYFTFFILFFFSFLFSSSFFFVFFFIV